MHRGCGAMVGVPVSTVLRAATSLSLAKRKIASYSCGVRRKPGALLPIEVAILATGVELRASGTPEFHGFRIAKALREHTGAEGRSRPLTAHGTLYKALDRLAQAGLVTSRWEDAQAAAEEGRPRRHLYAVTPLGERALARARMPASAPQAGQMPASQPGLAPP
jgi:DNA-binding PadR family transcriptional regulator